MFLSQISILYQSHLISAPGFSKTCVSSLSYAYIARILTPLMVLAEQNLEFKSYSISALLTVIMIIAGVLIFTHWLYKSRFGKDAFTDLPLRQADMPAYVPLFLIFTWILLVLVGQSLSGSITFGMPSWQRQFGSFTANAAAEVILIIAILFAVRRFFSGGLSGFGLRFRSGFSDFKAAILIFLASWPFVMVCLIIVVQIGRLVIGPGFELEQNAGLKVIIEFNNLPLRILTVCFAVLITPVFEEFLFRGILQSYLRNIGIGPWKSILFVSILFSALHPMTHFPALLVLSVCMGYAYEKSGSILRPVFIHMVFNGVMVGFSLLG